MMTVLFFTVAHNGSISHGHPCTDYNVPNHVDSLLKKRHPHAGKNRVRQGCRTRFSAQWTAAGIAKCSNEIGFDNFVKPDLAWKIFRKLFGNLAGKFHPKAVLGSGISPCKCVLTSKRDACVKCPPFRAGVLPPPGAAKPCAAEHDLLLRHTKNGHTLRYTDERKAHPSASNRASSRMPKPARPMWPICTDICLMI